MSFHTRVRRRLCLSAQLDLDLDTFLKLLVAQTIMWGFSWTREREVSTYIIFLTPGALWKHVHLFLAALLDQGYLWTSRITVHTVVYSISTSNNKAFQVKTLSFCHFSAVCLHGNRIFSPSKRHFLKMTSGVERFHNDPASVSMLMGKSFLCTFAMTWTRTWRTKADFAPL